MSDRTQSTASKALAVHQISPAEMEVIQVLGNSLYPGAKPESIAMVLAWCRATGRDPMKKPAHIVPMYVKDATTGKGEMRDTVMLGIGAYRTDAAATGEYAGKDEPEFGEDVDRDFDEGVRVTYPKWCKVAVQRLVGGQVRRFVAKEFWLENYATAGRATNKPNAMWQRRPYAQLAKCAEAQALRMAFPDQTGSTNTAEEMEGKEFIGMTIDQQSSPLSAAPATPTRDPSMVEFAVSARMFIAGMATTKALDAYGKQLATNLEILRMDAPELADSIDAAFDEARMELSRRQEAPAAQQTTEPPCQEAPKPTQAASPPPAAAAPPPPVEPAAFAVYATDQTGEPIANEDGEPLEFATPIAFAEWFARAAELVTNFEAFMENNADAIGDCRDDRAAAELISSALNAARDRLAGMRSPDAEPQEVNPLLVPVGKTPKGSPHWPNYFSDAKAAVASIADVIGLDAWVEVNRASWEAHPVATLKLEKIIADRRDALAPQAAEPTPEERRALFRRRLLADFQLCTTADDMRALARNPMVIRMMAEIQEHEPETWAELDAAGATRMAELKS